jgi:hypothetical protein
VKLNEGSNYLLWYYKLTGKGEEDTRHLDQVDYIPACGGDEIGKRAEG